jgi:hypothetical protein
VQPAQRVNPLKWTVSLLRPTFVPVVISVFLVKSASVVTLSTDLTIHFRTELA